MLIHGDGVGKTMHRTAAPEFGDVSQGFEEADRIREDLWHDFRGSTRAALEQHAAVASHGADAAHHLVIDPGAALLAPHPRESPELPAGRIWVVATPVGGGFWARPTPTRDRCCPARHGDRPAGEDLYPVARRGVFFTTAPPPGADVGPGPGSGCDGTITAMHFRTHLDGGAFGCYGLAAALLHGCPPALHLPDPQLQFEGVRVFTNKPRTARRCHGTPKPRFALESPASTPPPPTSIDPVTMWLRNLVKPFSTTVNYLRITSRGLQECIEQVVAASGFREKYGRLVPGRGVGLAVGAICRVPGSRSIRNDIPQSEVSIAVDRGGGVTGFFDGGPTRARGRPRCSPRSWEVLGIDPAS